MDIIPMPLDTALSTQLVVSKESLLAHYRDIYCRDVVDLNRLNAERDDVGGAHDTEWHKTWRRASNSVLLHEVYFSNIANGARPMAPAMELGLAANFHSAAAWREDFKSIARTVSKSPAWLLLNFNPRNGTLKNCISEDDQHFAGMTPILALDLDRHAYDRDYNGPLEYCDRYLDEIDWEDVYRRYRQAVHAVTENLEVEPGPRESAVFLDVRRAAAYEESDVIVPGAIWRDPTKVEEWWTDLPRNREIVCYCVSGYEVCRAAMLRLRTQGFNAHYLKGGIKGWQQAGFEAEPKPQQAKGK